MKFIIILLAVCLSTFTKCIDSQPLQGALRLPRATNIAKPDSVAIQEFSEVAKRALEKQKAIYEAVIQKLQVPDPNFPNLQAKLDELIAFNQRVSQLGDTEDKNYYAEIFQLIRLLMTLESKYDFNTKNLTDEEILIEQNLRQQNILRNGGLAYFVEFETKPGDYTSNIQAMLRPLYTRKMNTKFERRP